MALFVPRLAVLWPHVRQMMVHVSARVVHQKTVALMAAVWLVPASVTQATLAPTARARQTVQGFLLPRMVSWALAMGTVFSRTDSLVLCLATRATALMEISHRAHSECCPLCLCVRQTWTVWAHGRHVQMIVHRRRSQ